MTVRSRIRRHYRSIVDAPSTRDSRLVRILSSARFLRLFNYTWTSLVCTIFDQLLAGILFVVLKRPLQGMGFLRILIGTAVARCFSQALSYLLNHRFVFTKDKASHDQPPRRQSMARFLVTAVVILCLSTAGVYLLHRLLGVQESVAKLVMDSALFFLNYYLQHNWVFNNDVTVQPRRLRRRR